MPLLFTGKTIKTNNQPWYSEANPEAYAAYVESVKQSGLVLEFSEYNDPNNSDVMITEIIFPDQASVNQFGNEFVQSEFVVNRRNYTRANGWKWERNIRQL